MKRTQQVSNIQMICLGEETLRYFLRLSIFMTLKKDHI
jgi:hypothetical protein